MKSYNKSKIEGLFLELEKYPRRYGDPGSGVHADDLEISNSGKILEITKEILELCKSLPPGENGEPEKAQTYQRLGDILVFRSRVYFEKSIYGSDSNMVSNISKEKLLENFEERGSDFEGVDEAIKNLNDLLSDDLKEYASSIYKFWFLSLRSTCYRVLGNHEKAVKDAISVTEFSDSGRDGYSLLSHCYLDYKDYRNAIEAATKAIESSYPNTIVQGWAWRFRASIHKEIGNHAEAERDEKRYQEIIKNHKL